MRSWAPDVAAKGGREGQKGGTAMTAQLNPMCPTVKRVFLPRSRREGERMSVVSGPSSPTPGVWFHVSPGNDYLMEKREL